MKFMVLIFALMFSTGAFGAVAITNSSGVKLGPIERIKCGTGILCTKDTLTGMLSLVSSPTLAGPLTVAGVEATDGVLNLQADEADDNADSWQLLSVASGNTFQILNKTSGSFVAKLTMAASDGDITLTGGITGDGGDTMVGFLRPVTAATATTITAAQCGGVFVSAGAIEMELPEASAVIGCQLTFIVGNASNFTIDPDAADILLLVTNAAGDSLIADAVGEAITIVAISASQWAVVGAEKGTWTDSN